MLSYIFYRFFGWLAPRIPPWLGYWLFARIGDLAYILDERGRRAVYHNLQHVLGSNTSARVLPDQVRAVFHTQAYNYFDFFRLAAINPTEIEERVILEGWHHVEAARAMGRGVIVVALHFGNIDVTLQVLGIRGFRAVLVMEHLQPESMFRYVKRLRGRFGIEIIPVDGALKAMFRALRNGDFVILAMDRDVTGSGEVVEFFGAPARLPIGYARLARRTGAPILMAFALRLPDHSIYVHIEPPLEPPQTADPEADVQALVRHVVQIAEKHIRNHPEQWVMFQPIWLDGQ
jgi:KDO2-lipid IV(A) lauroyltransferase